MLCHVCTYIYVCMYVHIVKPRYKGTLYKNTQHIGIANPGPTNVVRTRTGTIIRISFV
jgi:hypothetical protein